MLRKALFALLIVILVAIVCTLLGDLLLAFRVEASRAIGLFLKQGATLIGIVAGVAYFISGEDIVKRP